MNREQELEKLLMTLFTLAPNVKLEHWDEVYEQYKNLDTVVQQPLSGSPEGSPKLCPQCGDKDIAKHDISGLVCINCGHNFR